MSILNTWIAKHTFTLVCTIGPSYCMCSIHMALILYGKYSMESPWWWCSTMYFSMRACWWTWKIFLHVICVHHGTNQNTLRLDVHCFFSVCKINISFFASWDVCAGHSLLLATHSISLCIGLHHWTLPCCESWNTTASLLSFLLTTRSLLICLVLEV